MKRVFVVDYGVGNLHSVGKALAREGGDVVVSSDPKALLDADRIVLPGVGAFGDAMKELERRGLVDAVKTHLERGRPFLGICLGMQLLLGESHEFGTHAGLGFIEGKVVRIPSDGTVKVPHVGWNVVEPSRPGAWSGTAFEGLEEERPRFYFVHSFHAQPREPEHTVADAWYGGVRIRAAVGRGAALGVQFHPEKSGPCGLRLIRHFLAQ